VWSNEQQQRIISISFENKDIIEWKYFRARAANEYKDEYKTATLLNHLLLLLLLLLLQALLLLIERVLLHFNQPELLFFKLRSSVISNSLNNASSSFERLTTESSSKSLSAV
jgi:hypothetical protein